MAKLVACKGCKQQVHPTAKTCPHCGVSNPGKNQTSGCLNILVVVISGVILIYLIDDKKPEPPKTPAEIRKEKLQHGFNPWNGEHIQLTRLIKQNMKNPDSYDHVKTTYIDKGDYLIIETTYRGTNSFGAVVPGVAAAKADLDGNIIELISQ